MFPLMDHLTSHCSALSDVNHRDKEINLLSVLVNFSLNETPVVEIESVPQD